MNTFVFFNGYLRGSTLSAKYHCTVPELLSFSTFSLSFHTHIHTLLSNSNSAKLLSFCLSCEIAQTYETIPLTLVKDKHTHIYPHTGI